MKSKVAPSIRYRLALLVLACIFPASLMAVLLISYDYQLTRSNFIRSAMATARANAMEVDKEFAVIESALIALGTSPSFPTHDLKALDAQARRLASRQDMFNIVLEDAAGQQLMNTFRPFGHALPLETENTALQSMRTSNATYISNLFVGTLSQRQIASIGVPFKADDGTFHALSATVAVESFASLLEQQSYPEDWIISILDRNGIVVARSSDMRRFVGTQAIPEVLRRLQTQPEGAFETETLDGKPILAVLAKANNSGWTVAIGIPLAKLSAEMNRKLWSLVLATVGLLGSGLFFAWKIGTAIRGSIHALVRPALALGAGDVVESASYGLHEANEVGRALVDASRRLQQARHQATHDVLTGIANRAMFCDFLERQLAICQRTETSLSVLYLDLDNFKTVNDTHGHAVGDRLLIAAAGRLTSLLRKSDMAARLGGDEFAVVLVGGGASDTANVVAKLGKLMAQPYHIDALALHAAASVGVAMFPQSGKTVASLVAFADHAMYLHKLERKQSR